MSYWRLLPMAVPLLIGSAMIPTRASLAVRDNNTGEVATTIIPLKNEG